jgi:hypothetical protein
MTKMPRKAAEFWWNLNKKDTEKISISPEIAYFYKDDVCQTFGGKGSDWIAVTWKDVFLKRKKRQDVKLGIKRASYDESITKPCFVWVFNVDFWIFAGWYVYIKTFKEDYALNFRQHNQDAIDKIMNLYPCGVIPMKENFDQWAKAFAKKYHHVGFNRKKDQGLLQCHCVIKKSKIIDIF